MPIPIILGVLGRVLLGKSIQRGATGVGKKVVRERQKQSAKMVGERRKAAQHIRETREMERMIENTRKTIAATKRLTGK